MEEKMPLVSVAVITYNSSKYVLETLESIKAQTYKNIELIISDDCSTDNTMQLCKNWCEQNKKRFARIQYVEVEQNTGVSANCNRAEDACEAEWVKLIAGDDLLLPNCITDFMDYVTKHKDVLCVFGKMQVFGGDFQQCQTIQNTVSQRMDKMSRMTTQEQLDMIIEGYPPPAPTAFKKRVISSQYKVLYDERIPMIEDRPQWINLLQQNVHLFVLDKYVVKYRLGGISNSTKWHSLQLFQNKRLMFFYYIWHYKYQKNPENIINETVDFECNIYNKVLEMNKLYSIINSSLLNRCIFKIMRLNYQLKENIKKLKK